MIVNPAPEVAEKFLRENPAVEQADLLIADGNGILRGKRVDRSGLVKVFEAGLSLPGSVFALDISGATVEASGLGFDQGDMDRICHPIPHTLAPVPWSETPAAQVLMTMYTVDGRPFFADPRHVLASVLGRLTAMGLNPVVAVELEFYLIDTEREASGAPRPPISPRSGRRESSTQVYSIEDLDNYEAFLSGVASAAAAQGIPADAAVAEYAPGQFEINLKHRPDALAACDDAVLLKRIIRAEAMRHGMEATFMAKPYPDQAGSGMHIHMSLVNEEGRNVFASEAPAGTEPLRQVIAGMAELMSESMALFAPTANAFRRLTPGNFAPHSPTWGINNRTTALRIPAGPPAARRVEHRVAGADANPYLVVAAVLAGAHHGLVNELVAAPPCSGNAYEDYPAELPADWLRALETLASGTRLGEYLGRDFVALHVALGEADRQRFEATITPLEYEWYLSIV